MNRISAALFILLGLATAALAQTVPIPQPNAGAYGAYNTAAPTCVNGSGCWLQTDVNGNLKTTATFTATTNAPVAPAAATAVNSTLTGCQATSVAINPTTGQQGAVDCDLNNNLLVSSGGAPNFSTSQVSVTTSSTATAAARALRRSVTITNVTGTQQVYCSGTVATTANGQLIPATVGASFTVSTTAAINCIAVTSAQTVSVAETF